MKRIASRMRCRERTTSLRLLLRKRPLSPGSPVDLRYLGTCNPFYHRPNANIEARLCERDLFLCPVHEVLPLPGLQSIRFADWRAGRLPREVARNDSNDRPTSGACSWMTWLRWHWRERGGRRTRECDSEV